MKQAQRNRLITIVAASVLGVAIIGGAAAAIVLNRQDDPKRPPVISDNVDSDTPEVTGSDTLVSSDNKESDTTDTQSGTDTPVVTEDVPPETTEVPSETTTVIPDDIQTENPGNPGEAQNGKPTDVASLKNYKGGYLDISAYPTTAELKKAASALKAEGYTAVMVEMKYDNGKLSYKSALEEAKQYGANPSIAALSLNEIVTALHDAGLYVTARVCAFRDDLAAKGNASLALMNTAGFRYSDGTSRWISVYSDAGQQYILSLLAEMKNAGVDEIMLRDYALPADYGTTSPQYDKNISKTDAVLQFISRVKDTLSGCALNLEMDALTIADNQNTQMGIACSSLAKYADSITADITLSNLHDGMKIGGVTIADVDADPKKTVETVLKALDSSALQIRPLFELTGNQTTDTAQIAAAQSRGYAAYQMTARVVRLNEK